MINNGSAVRAPLNSVAAIWSNSQNSYVGLAVWNQQAAQNGLGFLGPGSLGYLPVGVNYQQGTGLFATNVTNWFPMLGTSNPGNFNSQTSAQLYSAIQGIFINNTNFQSLQTQQQTRGGGPCNRMATRAQNIADRLIREAGSDLVFGNNRDASWDKALSDFDKEFTTMYVGQIIDGLRSAKAVYANGGGTKGGPMSQYGQRDFKDDYLDTEWPRNSTDINADQVHHFAGFLSMGINAVSLAAFAHAAQDLYNGNPGDVALSEKAYSIGSQLRKEPRRLKYIGSDIRESICIPSPGAEEGVGRH